MELDFQARRLKIARVKEALDMQAQKNNTLGSVNINVFSGGHIEG